MTDAAHPDATHPAFAPGDAREQPAPPAPPAAAAPAGRTGALELPDRRLFWRWVWEAVRPVLGWVLVGLGALALFLGWYGVSGQSLTAKQLPYLVSGGLTGIALIVLAGVFLATDDVRRQLSRVSELERKLDDLYGLFVADLAAAPPTSAAQPTSAVPPTSARTPSQAIGGLHTAVVALPAGTSYHRPDCALVAGKDGAETVSGAAIADRGLKPCRVCDPAPPAAA